MHRRSELKTFRFFYLSLSFVVIDNKAEFDFAFYTGADTQQGTDAERLR